MLGCQSIVDSVAEDSCEHKMSRHARRSLVLVLKLILLAQVRKRVATVTAAKGRIAVQIDPRFLPSGATIQHFYNSYGSPGARESAPDGISSRSVQPFYMAHDFHSAILQPF